MVKLSLERFLLFSIIFREKEIIRRNLLSCRSKVTKAWGYYIWNAMAISSKGTEYSPKINFGVNSGAWYNLKSVVKGTHVKIYVNNKLVKEITMKGSGADSKSNNYVGLWCHARQSIKGDSFQVQGNTKFQILRKQKPR